MIVLSSANLVQCDPPKSENGLTESPLKTGGKCSIVDNSVVHCRIVLKFGRLMQMHYGQNDWRDVGRPQVAMQCDFHLF